MKVIFLDIDGVLNHEEWYKRPKVIAMSKRPGFKGTEKEYHFDPKAWKWVQKLITETGAKIVLSSSWRWYDLPSTIKDFKGTAFQPILDNLVGVTPALLNRCRGEEIRRFFDIVTGNIIQNVPGFKDFLRDHPLETITKTNQTIDAYVIIDDCCDVTKEQKSHLVQVDSWVGMQKADYKKAKEILENGRQ